MLPTIVLVWLLCECIYFLQDALAVWNGRRVIIYEYSEDKSTIKASGSFTTDSMVVCLYEQNVYCIELQKVQVRTFQVCILTT